MSQIVQIVSDEILHRLQSLQQPSRDDLDRIKIEVCRKHRAPAVPANSEILGRVPESLLPRLRPLLTSKQVRSLSGVTTVAVMPKPWGCPHGKCTYCPGGPEVGVPRAYTGEEPAVKRALETNYDPYFQVNSRIRELGAIGHIVDKVELILVGGTFPFLPRDYQEGFVKRCLDALNGTEAQSLDEAKTIAETSPRKNVGITIETRPDWSRRVHVDHMLNMGVTRVEIGVQTLYDDVYQRIHRDHTVEDAVEASQTLKDSGLKVGYHMMLGLPGCDPKGDLRAFERVFQDPDFKPDMLKIYPCLVTPGTQLYEEWKRGEYKPYSTEESARLIVEVKKLVPPWVRIMRIQREIPRDGIADGVKQGNLRQIVQDEMEKRGLKCPCIRCREIGHATLRQHMRANPGRVELIERIYEASGGKEVFLSFEEPDLDLLIGYIRLRIPGEKTHRPEISGQDAAIVRELHVFGKTVPVGERLDNAYQHKGYGGRLLLEAERIAVETYERKKMVVISALGTKKYYARYGYHHDGPYVSKPLFQ